MYCIDAYLFYTSRLQTSTLEQIFPQRVALSPSRCTEKNEARSLMTSTLATVRCSILVFTEIHHLRGHKFPIPTVRSFRALKAFLPSSIILWNDLPSDIQELRTVASFKAASKKHLKLYMSFLTINAVEGSRHDSILAQITLSTTYCSSLVAFPQYLLSLSFPIRFLSLISFLLLCSVA